MKRIVLITVMMCVCILLGCTGEEIEKTPEIIKTHGEDERSSKDIEESETNPVTEEISDTESVSENTEEINLFEDLLSGQGKLYFHNYNHMYIDTPIFDISKGYTIDEIIDILSQDYYMFEQRPQISYAYLDLGNDGIMEYAVQFTGMGIYGLGDDSTLVYIIKEKQGVLELCFSYETWARSDSSLNCSGYYTSAGSSSATCHVVSCGYINGMGEYHYICSTEYEYDIVAKGWEEDFTGIVEKMTVSEGEEPYSLITICFDEILTEDDYYNVERYYTFEPTGTEKDDVYWNVFEEEGVRLYPYGEVKQLINEKEQNLGITDEIKMDEPLSWIALE